MSRRHAPRATTPMTTPPVAAWRDYDGSVYVWPQSWADNRRSRVLARIRSFGMACDPSTLRIFRDRLDADAYATAIHAA